ncbi:MAG TPA: YceI family protein [Methylibium sp.]|nr:YceI family protein [Methylibium sp.]
MKTLATTLLALAAAATLASGPACAQTAARLLPGSEIAFVSKQLGVPVEGKFKRFDAQIAIDPKNPTAGKVALTIDTGSAGIGDPDTDRELPKPEWFSTAKFPQASFQSSAIKALGGGRYEVAGTLAIKGNRRDVVVPVTLTQSGATSIATGAFTIKRLEFRIGDGEWADTSMVADEVQVKFKLALAGIGAP